MIAAVNSQESISAGERQRLLALFPVANLRAGFPITGSKEEICIAAQNPAKMHNSMQ